MMQWWRIRSVRGIALVNAVFVIVGLHFLIDAIWGNYEFWLRTPTEPYYTQVFFARTMLNLGFLAALAVASVGIWRLKPSGLRLCNVVFIGEILYWVSTTAISMAIWRHGGVLRLLGQALAESGGTGDMGINPQFITVYPVIALVILNLTFPEPERNSAKTGSPITKWRGLAHRAGVLLGVIVGMVFFGDGALMLHVGRANGWVEIVFWLLTTLAFLSFLPVGILSIFRPRAAAYGVAAATVLLQAANWGAVAFGLATADWSFHNLAHIFLLEVLSPCVVAVLLFYGSAPAAVVGTGAEARGG